MIRAPRLVALAALLVAGSCSRPPEKRSLLVAGSSTMHHYFVPLVKEFTRRHPDARIVLEGGGSTAAMIALKRDAVDVAMLAREIEPDQDDDYLRDFLVARDGVGIIVHPKNPVSDLKLEQLAGIFEGKIVNWKEVGGPDVPIVAVTRGVEAPVRKSFSDLVLAGDDPFPGAKVVEHSHEMVAAVLGDPGAIGFVTLHKIHESPSLKVISVNGVEMNRATILSERYPLGRSLFLVHYLEPSPLATELIDFARSKDGQEILYQEGLVAAYPH